MMGKELDLSQFALPTTMVDVSSSLAAEPPARAPTGTATMAQRIDDGEYLAGPICMGWVGAAANLPGAALDIAILIRHYYMMRGQDWVVLSNSAVARFGVSTSAKSRALKVLKEAGLIETQDPRAGCAPRVKPVGDGSRSVSGKGNV